jgi:hypothetical protein
MKSRSIAGVAAAAAAAEPTGTEGIGPGAGGATGAEPIDAEFSNGDSRGAVAATGDEVDEAGSAEAADAIGADVGGIGSAEVRIVVGAEAGDAADIPGGGDATASGSSISSSGRSGSCSSKGEAGTPAKASGKLGLTAVAEAADVLVDPDGAWNPDAGGWDANCPCNDVMVPLAEVPPAGIDTVDAFDGPATASDEVGDPPTADIPAAGGALTDVPDTVGTTGGALTDVPDTVGTADDVLTDALDTVGTGGDVLTDALDTVGAAGDVLTGAPARVGTVVVGALTVVPAALGTVVDLPTDPPAEVAAPDDVPDAPAAPPVSGFAADEPTAGATPTGLEIFFAPWPTESEVDALRGAAPAAAPKPLGGAFVETPTGREAPPGVVADGEDVIPGL